jgi:hypothetical protein
MSGLTQFIRFSIISNSAECAEGNNDGATAEKPAMKQGRKKARQHTPDTLRE